MLHANPPKFIGSYPVAVVTDYLDGTKTDLESGTCEKIPLSGSDVISLRTAGDDSLIIRPSGTEPKIRCYIMVTEPSAEACDKKAEIFVAEAKKLMSRS